MPTPVKQVLFWLIAQLPYAGGLALWFQDAKAHPTGAFLIWAVYQVGVLVVGFAAKVWGKLEPEMVTTTADWVKGASQRAVSRFRRRYNQQVIYDHRTFNVKGLRTQGTYNLRLDQVFVDLRIAPNNPQAFRVNPLTAQEVAGNRPIWEFLRQQIKQEGIALAIIGPPGCGKTTLLQHLALTFAANHQRRHNLPTYTPLLLFLRDVRATITSDKPPSLAGLAETYFTEQRDYPKPPAGWFERQLKRGKCIVLLDGLDEVADPDQRVCVAHWVDRQIKAYPHAPMVITARPQGYRSAPLEQAHILSRYQKVPCTFLRSRVRWSWRCYMIYVRPLIPAEVDELRSMLRREVGRVSQRAHLILLSAQHTSVPDLARLFAWSRATVRFWIGRFEAAGPDGLRDAPRSGRPRKITPVVESRLTTLLQHDPQRIDRNFLATCWTTAMLVLLCATQLHITVCQSTIRSALQRLGLRWRRPRLAMPRTPDPRKAAKQWQIAAAMVSATPDVAIVYADESRIQTLPLVRAMWQQRGQQVRIPTPGTNRAITLFGALNIRTGRWEYILRNRMQADDFLLFLTYLLACYRDQPIIVIVDNYSSHTAQKVRAWVEDEPRLDLLFLPTHCAHLNPVERIWLQLKNTIAPNRLYGSLEVLRQTVFAFFRAMTYEQALRWAATEM